MNSPRIRFADVSMGSPQSACFGDVISNLNVALEDERMRNLIGEPERIGG